ncbi:hypothetical protein [Paucilactobacillus wasatchensis]|uniref:hypothetical protein n=1 Tax=Paucilactobacillus wasatchensis TaxID=1335616 RepID=UPI0005C5BD4F|nr:hypothetical protein [Paucilactobacillus wasatchensis]
MATPPINKRPNPGDKKPGNFSQLLKDLLLIIVVVAIVFFTIIWFLWDFPQSAALLFFGSIAAGLTRR